MFVSFSYLQQMKYNRGYFYMLIRKKQEVWCVESRKERLSYERKIYI